jgi:hypothetical protein
MQCLPGKKKALIDAAIRDSKASDYFSISFMPFHPLIHQIAQLKNDGLEPYNF